MDAVSFVVGVNTAQLRGSKLADFRSNLETATEAPTSVTLHYHAPRQAGERHAAETLFTRTITSRDANEWRVDGRKVIKPHSGA
jgi:chromosome segregation ATPase